MGIFRLFRRNSPKINSLGNKKDGFGGWIKCEGCGETIHSKQLEQAMHCCPKCQFHYRLSAQKRIEFLIDQDTFNPLFEDVLPKDPLQFKDQKAYKDRLKESAKKSGVSEACQVGVGQMNGVDVAIGVMNFAFMGGSMGSVVGERLTRLIEHATENRLPLIIVTASGGARMQESVLSLMQMAKTSAALAKHDDAGLLYISLLTNPTMGGVTASFAMLGDLIVAEPKALIGFTGPRVIEQTIRRKLPQGAQTAEFLLEKGAIDAIVPRNALKGQLAWWCQFFSKKDDKECMQKNRQIDTNEFKVATT